jgi:type II secretory pathway pseudopilin PulG
MKLAWGHHANLKSDMKNDNQGFTIIEVVASISLILFLTSIFLAGLSSAGKKGDLTMSAQKMASDIRVAQNLSLNFQEFRGQLVDSGWGVHFRVNDDFYTIFADLPDGSGVKDMFFDPANGERYQEMMLPEGTIIKEIKYNRFSADPLIESVPQLSLVFQPPDPIVHMCDTAACSLENEAKMALIELENSRGTTSVMINHFGLIDAKN